MVSKRAGTSRAASAGRKPVARAKSVSFGLQAPSAHRVTLAGEFNDWNPEVAPMKLGTDGTWSVRVRLKPGAYQYKFVVDGEWWTDPANPSRVSAPDGSVNSVLDVA